MPPPVTLPPACDLTPLGLSAGRIESLEIICQRSVNTIYRIRCAGRWHVLKWIEWPEKSVELLAYRLLQQENVPVLPHRAAGRALLLEDLAHSTTWRLAEECDMGREETGRSLAAWYRQLHAAGHRLLATDPAALAALGREVDAVTPAAVGALGTRFDLPAPLLRRAAAQIDPITQAIRRLPQTLTYNDFHGSNLALHRSDPAQAVVFD